MTRDDKPLVLITGAAGDVGSRLAAALGKDYRVVGMDRPGAHADVPLIEVDLSADASVRSAFEQLRTRHGARLASVIHLAAYFDFTGEDDPKYRSVNVDGTRRLVRALQGFEVEQIVYSGTMLVYAPCEPGQTIDESAPIAPKWAYPRSKAAAEEVLRQEHGTIPLLLLHLAGIYDEQRSVPTLAHQIQRVYERELTGHLYAGDPRAGQSLLHKDDMVDAFRRAVDRRAALPPRAEVLVGEPEAMGYEALQNTIGRLIHGEAEWTTLQVAKPAAKLGAVAQSSLEAAIPDAIDQGREPFIRPFMVAMADDHYALDIGQAHRLLGWQPRHRIRDELPAMIAALKRDPIGWYRANGIELPAWLADARASGMAPEPLRRQHEAMRRAQHRASLWAPFCTVALGLWLMTSPLASDTGSLPLAASEAASGAALALFGALSLSWRLAWARWVCALIGLWLLTAPLVFWAPQAATLLNGTLAGMLAIGFALLVPPEPGVAPVASLSGPLQPPGWSFNPSAWPHRLVIIALALVGLLISRHLAAYQLGHIDAVWEPFFGGGPDPKNGSEEIITSALSQAWPVPDAGLGALTYALEILTGAIGSQRRWRTMPWMVLLFGVMIVPLGVVSIFFIVVQPIWIGTWCTLCLVAAVAMLVQIPYSLDEIVATGQFLRRRQRAGRPWLRVLFAGDTDEGGATPARDGADRAFDRSPRQIAHDMAHGVSLSAPLAGCLAIGVWLMFTRLTLGASGAMAHADHLIGSLVVTVTIISCAEIARSLRWLNGVLGVALMVAALRYTDDTAQIVGALLCGAALIALSVPKRAATERYGGWERFIH